jgi:hypothetical protein
MVVRAHYPATHVTSVGMRSSKCNTFSFRCVVLPRQHVRRCEKQRMYRLQSRHVLSGGNSNAVALPRRLPLPGRRRCAGCAAARLPRGLVLQRQRSQRGHALPSGVPVSVRGLEFEPSVPDRVRVSDGRLDSGSAVSARSVLPRARPGPRGVVSVGPLQPADWREQLDGLRAVRVRVGFAGVAGQCCVRVRVSRWLVSERDGLAVRLVSGWGVLPRRREPDAALSSRYAAAHRVVSLCAGSDGVFCPRLLDNIGAR